MTVAESNAPLPKNISHIIQRKGLVQRTFAERAGYSAQQFSDMLNGRKIIKPCDILAITNALGCSINELFEDTGQDGA